MKNIVYLLLILAPIFSACSSKPVIEKKELEDSSAAYNIEKERLSKQDIISPGFVLGIRHEADAQINGSYEVKFDGNLELPYKVVVPAAGLSLGVLKTKIENSYREYFKANNRVHVEIEDKKYYVEIRGLVKNPGRYRVRLDTSIEELVATAGGFINAAGIESSLQSKVEYLRIERPASIGAKKKPDIIWIQLASYFYKYDMDADLLWKGGEKLYFQNSIDPDASVKHKQKMIQVLGEVRTPGEYTILPDADLYSYIIKSGGPSTAADLRNVLIFHRSRDTKTTVDLLSSRIADELRPGDIILVPAIDTKPSTTERIISSTALVISAISTVVLLLLVL